MVNLTYKRISAKKTLIRKLYKCIRKNGHCLEQLKTISQTKIKDININMKNRTISAIKNFLNKEINVKKNNNEKSFLSELKRTHDKLKYKSLNIPYYKQEKKEFSTVYARSADDWIILTNMKIDIVQGIKEKIRVFL
jgi:hypothetical protein